jgi:hypothetical protein
VATDQLFYADILAGEFGKQMMRAITGKIFLMDILLQPVSVILPFPNQILM